MAVERHALDFRSWKWQNCDRVPHKPHTTADVGGEIQFGPVLGPSEKLNINAHLINGTHWQATVPAATPVLALDN